MVDKKKQGKRNRANGKAFELKVRVDLEKEGWIVCKWQNNVNFHRLANPPKDYVGETTRGELVPTKPKFNPFTKSLMMNSGGFPDYVAYRKVVAPEDSINSWAFGYEIIGVECKVGKYLDKAEKEKCKWLLDKKVFTKIFVASKIPRGIKYEEMPN